MNKNILWIRLYTLSIIMVLCVSFASFATENQNQDDLEIVNIGKYISIDAYKTITVEEFEKQQKEKEESEYQEQNELKENSTVEDKNIIEDTQNLNGELTTTEIQEPLYNEDGYEIIREYKDGVGDELIKELKYDKHWIGRYYIVALGGSVNVRSGPGFNYPVVKKALHRRKYTMIETVKGAASKSNKSKEWHHIIWWKNGKLKKGYVYSGVVTEREFRFEYIFDMVKKLNQEISQNTNTAYINNVRNIMGAAPKYQGSSNFDAYGIERYQSAPAYTSINKNTSEMRYMQDGLLVAIEGESDGLYKVRTYDFPGVYYVPKKYVSKNNQVQNLTQVVAVDLTNQNEITYEFRDGNWYVVSYNFATTGAKKSKYREPTIPGSYKIIQKKDEFLYIDDEEKYIDGYAPYALRFNGGAFIHGVPVEFIQTKETVEVEPAILDAFGNVIKEAVTEEKVIPNKYKRPPKNIEYSHTLGTVPLSHKCVRNATSHAKFLLDWIDLNKSSILVVK